MKENRIVIICTYSDQASFNSIYKNYHKSCSRFSQELHKLLLLNHLKQDFKLNDINIP